jgi:hypothetical protein
LKTNPPRRSHIHRGACLALLAGGLAAGLAAAHAAPPRLQPLRQGKWPTWPRGDAHDVKVVGNYAYVALGAGGLAVIDVSNRTNCTRVGGYQPSAFAAGMAVSGNYAYVADRYDGLEVIDVSNPTNCVRVGVYDTSGDAWAWR